MIVEVEVVFLSVNEEEEEEEVVRLDLVQDMHDCDCECECAVWLAQVTCFWSSTSVDVDDVCVFWCERSESGDSNVHVSVNVKAYVNDWCWNEDENDHHWMRVLDRD
mmetsp:Transcript_25293/g.41188  ORF Transcript_25293/g.41188 Transcript_25293/m.41188 type:complete len:107 (-) Transcript_25293:476-796(-)